MRKTPKFTNLMPSDKVMHTFDIGTHNGWRLLKSNGRYFSFREHYYKFCSMPQRSRTLDPKKMYFKVVHSQLNYVLIGPNGKRVSGVLGAADLGISDYGYFRKLVAPPLSITNLNMLKDTILKIAEKRGHIPKTDQLGKGSFGTVYKVYPVDEQTGFGIVNKPYALKKIVVYQNGDPKKEAYQNAHIKDEHAFLTQNRYTTEPLVSIPFQLFNRVVVGWCRGDTPAPDTFEIVKVQEGNQVDTIKVRWTNEKGEVVIKCLPLTDFENVPLSEAGEINDSALLQKLQSRYSIGTEHYIITEYVPGTELIKSSKDDGAYTVNDLLKKASFEKRLDVIIQLFDQLHSLHHQRPDRALPLIHRDVKWENILFDGKSVRLVDFGLARAVEREGKFVIPQDCINEGTFLAVAPEAVTDAYVETSSDDYAMTPIIAVLFGALDPCYEKYWAYQLVKNDGGYDVQSGSALVLGLNQLYYRIENQNQIFHYEVMLPSGTKVTKRIPIAQLGNGITIDNIHQKMKDKEKVYRIMAELGHAPLELCHKRAYYAKSPYIIDDMLHTIYPKKYPQDLKPIIFNFVNRMQSINPQDRPTSVESLRFFTALSHFCKAHKASRKWFLGRDKKSTLKEQMATARVEVALIEKGIDVERYFRQWSSKPRDAECLEDIIYGEKYPEEVKAFLFEFLKRMQDKDQKIEEDKQRKLEQLPQMPLIKEHSISRETIRIEIKAQRKIIEDKIKQFGELGRQLPSSKKAMAVIDGLQLEFEKEQNQINDLFQEVQKQIAENNQLERDSRLEVRSFFKTLKDFCNAYDKNPDLTQKNSDPAIYHLGLALKAKDLDRVPHVKEIAIRLFDQGVIPTKKRIDSLVEASKKTEALPSPLERAEEKIIAEDKNDKNIQEFTACYKRSISFTLFGLGRSEFGKRILEGQIQDFGQIELYASTTHHAAHQALQEMKRQSAARAA